MAALKSAQTMSLICVNAVVCAAGWMDGVIRSRKPETTINNNLRLLPEKPRAELPAGSRVRGPQGPRRTTPMVKTPPDTRVDLVIRADVKDKRAVQKSPTVDFVAAAQRQQQTCAPVAMIHDIMDRMKIWHPSKASRRRDERKVIRLSATYSTATTRRLQPLPSGYWRKSSNWNPPGLAQWSRIPQNGHGAKNMLEELAKRHRLVARDWTAERRQTSIARQRLNTCQAARRLSS